jgi:hypothetical protein
MSENPPPKRRPVRPGRDADQLVSCHPLGERQVAAVLLDDAARQRALAAGTIILADKGVAGRSLHRHVQGLGAHLVRPDRKGEPPGSGRLAACASGSRRSSTPSTTSSAWERHGGAPWAGVCPRRPAAAALAAAICWNWQLGSHDKRSLLAFDH